jgi:methionine-R-sulfoxide reductase
MPENGMRMRTMMGQRLQQAAVIAVLGIAPCAMACAQTPATKADSRAVKETPHGGSHNMSDYRKPSDSELKQKLDPLQYQVTQHEATERPFQNALWDNHEPGIYVDVVSGEPLFSSLDKFDSGTGWPSFTRPLVPENVKTKTDRSLLMARTEVRSAHADSHLGHLFDDGPKPTGMRYCMNSASMRFIPVAKLAEEGYGEFAPLFEHAKK